MTSFDLASLDPRIVATAVHTQGVALIQNAVPEAKVSYFLDLFRAIYRTQDEAFDQNGPGAVSRDYFDGAIHNDHFVEQSPNGFCLFDLVVSTKMITVLNAVLGQNYYEKYAVVRRMAKEYQGSEKIWSNHLSFHSDAQYHDDEKYSINVWMPLTPGCAVTTPGLEVILEGHEAVRSSVSYNKSSARSRDTFGRCSRFHNEFYFSDELEKLRKQRSMIPLMDVGDVLIFSNWTIHRTFIPDSCKSDRISLECRIETDSFDPSTSPTLKST